MIYLDNAATSFPKPPEVIEAVSAALAAPASPGRSGHAASLQASRIIHRARKNLAKLFGIKDNSRLVFMPNITWALNAALDGLNLQPGDHVISSAMEHNAAARPLNRLAAERGIVWEMAPADSQGFSEPDDFKKLLRPQTRLLVLNHASNVTGTLAPAREIKAAIGEVPLLLDAAQTAGALDLSEAGDWVDLLAFTGHKGLMGPTGTGGLYIRPGLNLRPLAVGGTGSASESIEAPDFLPDAQEPGTANTHGLAGLAAGVELVLKTGVERIRAHEMDLSKKFLDGLARIPGLRVWGPPDTENRVATIAVTLQGYSSSDLSAALERQAGILTRPGLHCAPLAHRHLGTLESGGSTRFSIGLYNSEEDIVATLETLAGLAKQK